MFCFSYRVYQWCQLHRPWVRCGPWSCMIQTVGHWTNLLHQTPPSTWTGSSTMYAAHSTGSQHGVAHKAHAPDPLCCMEYCIQPMHCDQCTPSAGPRAYWTDGPRARTGHVLHGAQGVWSMGCMNILRPTPHEAWSTLALQPTLGWIFPALPGGSGEPIGGEPSCIHPLPGTCPDPPRASPGHGAGQALAGAWRPGWALLQAGWLRE